jgi:hypothetical protein
MAEAPYRATFLGRARPRAGLADSTLLVQRQRFIDAGMREDIVLRNREAAACTLTIQVEADAVDPPSQRCRGSFETRESVSNSRKPLRLVTAHATTSPGSEIRLAGPGSCRRVPSLWTSRPLASRG